MAGLDPAIPIRKACTSPIEITGTRPVMTLWVMTSRLSARLTGMRSHIGPHR